jgi:hypothetical protein
MESTMATNSELAVRQLWTRYPKLLGGVIFLVSSLAALSAGLVMVAEIFVIGGNMFAIVGLFLPVLIICLIVLAFFAWSKNYVIGLATVVVSALLLLTTIGVLNEQHHAPHGQKLAPLQVTYFLLMPLLFQLLNAIFSIYKLARLRLLR